MYAIIQTGGKQYRVSEGDKVKVELLEAKVGDSVRFTDVRLLRTDDDVKVGKPSIEGASVTAKVLEHGRHKKITVFKHHRRKTYRLKKGHRQFYTQVQITDVAGQE